MEYGACFSLIGANGKLDAKKCAYTGPLGKTGVDLPEGKNYAGAYHQPSAVLVDPSSPADPDPIKVMFRVLEEGDHYAVVDASIAGVWLGLAQRDDFVGFLGQHNNSIPELTAHLKEMTAKFDAPPKAAAAQ